VLNYKQRNGKPYTVGSINDQLKLAYTAVTKYGVKSGYLKKAEADAISYETLKDKNQDDEIALRDDEILKLYNHKCQDPKDEIIKDVFLLECTTGQRISDTSRINDSVKTVGGVDLIELVQRKTGKRIVIDLIFDIAKKILVDKYNYNVPSITGNTKMAERDVINPRIKHICKEAGVGVDETVTLIKHIAGKDKADEITVPRYTKVSTHTGRRTFVTMLSLRGWNYEQIGKYTGQTEIDTVKLYDKSKGDQSYLAIFKQSKKAGNILRMIDEQPEEKQDLLSILDNLASYEKAGINIYNLPEIKTVVRLVKSSTTVLTNSILKYRNMIWEIGKHTADTALMQIFQLKLKQAGLSTEEVIDAETLKEIWQNELANDELDYYSK
jgi:integrase